MIKPEPSSRHPLVVLFLLVIMASGLTYLFTDEAPGSVESQLYEWMITLWALSLVVGSGLVLFGIAIQPDDARLVRGVQAEMIGMSLLGPSAIMYSVAILGTVGWATGGLPAGLAFGFGVACLYRMYSLVRQIRAAQREAAESDGANTDGRH